jgi:UDP-N-acetylmuramate dehydrogenase
MFSLKHYSTFRIDVSATELVTISHIDDLLALTHTDTYKNNLSRLIVGGGSNILFTQDFDGLIIHNKIQ